MKSATIYSLESLRAVLHKNSRVLCLYSGGLDGTYLLHWLTQIQVGTIIPLCIDLGGDHNTAEIQARARSLGLEPKVVDARELFARHYVLPAIIAKSGYLRGHPICASLSRPLMAKIAYEVAHDSDAPCDTILHTSNSSQNSLRRFNGALGALGFGGHFGSPFAQSGITREKKETTLTGLGVPLTGHNLFSTDTNLWGREFEYGSIDDPHRVDIPEFLYQWSRPQPGLQPRELALTFRRGRPVAINDEPCALLPLIARLNATVGAYGLGRYVGLEEIASGVKVQEVREMPAAHILFDAFARLEGATLSFETIRVKGDQEQIWVREAVEGRWFLPLREASQRFLLALARKITGRVVYRLNYGRMDIAGTRADEPLYVRSRDEFEHSHPVKDSALPPPIT